MKWYEAYYIIECGGMVRRKGWEEGVFIRMVDDLDNDDDLYLINEKQEYIEVTEEELRATDWVEYDPYARSDEDLKDHEYLRVVRARCEAKMSYQQRILRNRLQSIAEKHGAIPIFEESEDVKYFITYSYYHKKYYVDTTYKEYHPSVVYFSTKESCEEALKVCQHMMDTARMLDRQFASLYSHSYSREELVEINNKINRVKIL